MYCPNCGQKIPNNARVCSYCGNDLGRSAPAQYQQPAPPPQIIVQSTNSGGLFSSLAGLFNFALGALVIGLIVFIVLIFLCVIKLPSSFPIINLPSQMDVLWSRAVLMQAQTCGGSSGTTPRYEPPVVQPGPVQPAPDQPEPVQPQPVEPEPVQPEPPQPPACNSDLGKADCEAAGGDYRYIFMDPGPNINMCICP